MAVLGVLPKTDTLFGLMPIFGGNVALHAGTAAAELLTEGEAVKHAYSVVSDKVRSIYPPIRSASSPTLQSVRA